MKTIVIGVAALVSAAAVQRATAPAGTSQIPGFIGNEVQPPKMSVPEGFTPIFNGKDLTGWHVSKTNHHGITPDYHVLHGMIVGTQRPLGSAGILLTDKQYRNYEIYMEVKPDWGCDSGLFLRSDEAGDAYQVTLDYLPGGTLGGMFGEGLNGVNGAMNAYGTPERARAEAQRASQPPQRGAQPQQPMAERQSERPDPNLPWVKAWKREEWNTIRARMEGDVPHIQAWINDQPVLDFTDTANHAMGGITEGPIGIQIHGGNRWVPGGFWRWRVIALKEIK
jgi:3-keto-disaccharide hydrolase